MPAKKPRAKKRAKRAPTRRKAKQPTQSELDAAFAKVLKKYGARDYVTAVDIGSQYTEGKPTGITTVRVHVREKHEDSALEAAEIFPKEVDGIPLDVIEGHYEAGRGPDVEGGRRTRSRKVAHDPLVPGISVGHSSITAGTLGAIVVGRNDGSIGALSNWHVLHGGLGSPGDAVLQPGRADGGSNPRDTIGTLANSILNADGDAAVALLDESRGFKPNQFESGKVITESHTASIGEIVEKSGRSTGITRGRVDGVGRYFINYSVGRRGIDGFKIVPVDEDNPNDEEISEGGDSGSLWYSVDDGEGVGLHFAGETLAAPSAEHAIACHLPRVLDALEVDLAGPELRHTTLCSPKFDQTQLTPPVPSNPQNGAQSPEVSINVEIEVNGRPYHSSASVQSIALESGVAPSSCTILDRTQCSSVVIGGIRDGLTNPPAITETTSLTSSAGLGLDDQAKGLLAFPVRQHVRDRGCRLSNAVNTDAIRQLHTVGDIVSLVWSDLNSNLP
ncbi:MAG: hypothetical protein AAF591_22935 [Verrucomicrobiota bacterium]